MASTSMRIEESTLARLKVIARDEQKSVGKVLTDLVDEYEKDRFWRQAREDFARVRADPEAWQEYLDEAAAWQRASASAMPDDSIQDSVEEASESSESHG